MERENGMRRETIGKSLPQEVLLWSFLPIRNRLLKP
jgi:hypothetical protein